MPQVRSKSAVRPPRRRAQESSGRLRPIPRTRRGASPPVQAIAEDQPLAILALPSPAVGNTCTTHNEMLFWVGWFARFHNDSPPYVPYELKTLDCPVVRADGSPALLSDGQPQMMRCVREVARSEVGDSVEWHMISWNLSQIGATFHRCASLDEALAAFNAPPAPVLLP